MRHERLGLLALLTVTLVWGTTFPAMKLLSGQMAALEIIWVRFAIAGGLLAPLWWGMRRAERRWGLLLGALLFLAFWLQVEGLARTSSNRNAFVTGLSVLLVPLIAMAVLGRRYGARLWAACALALAGMALMFYENEPWNRGDSLTLLSAFVYAAYILVLEACARRHAAAPLRAFRMAAAQAAMMLACASALLVAQHGAWGGLDATLPRIDAQAWTALAYLGVLASIVVVTLQAWGQQRVDAMRSAIVFGLEPVFAALAAWGLIGERMGPSALLGAALIVAALVFSQWAPPLRRTAAA